MNTSDWTPDDFEAAAERELSAAMRLDLVRMETSRQKCIWQEQDCTDAKQILEIERLRAELAAERAKGAMLDDDNGSLSNSLTTFEADLEDCQRELAAERGKRCPRCWFDGNCSIQSRILAQVEVVLPTGCTAWQPPREVQS